MTDNYINLISESQNIEMQISDLYLLFFNTFIQDSEFWWELSIEEMNHACLIGSLKRSVFRPFNEFPLSDLKIFNRELNTLIKKYKINTPSRDEAFSSALQIEKVINMLFSQKIMNGNSNLELKTIFKRLIGVESNHSERICAYMKKHGVLMESVTRVPPVEVGQSLDVAFYVKTEV